MAATRVSLRDFLPFGEQKQRFQAKHINPELLSGVFKDKTKTEVVAVFDVQNHYRCRHFELCAAEIAEKNDGYANIQKLYHTTKEKNVISILNDGFDPRIANQAFFGKGIYFTDDPSKANEYSGYIGNARAIRVMFECSVVLGREKEYSLGEFDKNLLKEPIGYDSVKGFIRRANEFVVYRTEQVCINRVIVYRWVDTDAETVQCYNIPKNINPCTVVYITPCLSEFFYKLKSRSGAENLIQIKREIQHLLENKKSVKEFLENICVVLKSLPPPDLQEKIEIELKKCCLNTDVVATSANQLVPAIKNEKEDNDCKRPRIDTV